MVRLSLISDSKNHLTISLLPTLRFVILVLVLPPTPSSLDLLKNLSYVTGSLETAFDEIMQTIEAHEPSGVCHECLLIYHMPKVKRHTMVCEDQEGVLLTILRYLNSWEFISADQHAINIPGRLLPGHCPNQCLDGTSLHYAATCLIKAENQVSLGASETVMVKEQFEQWLVLLKFTIFMARMESSILNFLSRIARTIINHSSFLALMLTTKMHLQNVPSKPLY